MSNLFLILMGIFIVVANVIGFVSYKKKKNLYAMAFTLLFSAVLFGTIGGVLALVVIRDAFAIFYGLQVGYYLLINSFTVFLIAIFASVIKKINNRTT